MILSTQTVRVHRYPRRTGRTQPRKERPQASLTGFCNDHLPPLAQSLMFLNIDKSM